MISIDNNQTGEHSLDNMDNDLGVFGEVDLDKIFSEDSEPISKNSTRGSRSSGNKSKGKTIRDKTPTKQSSRRKVDDYIDTAAKTSRGREKAMRILGKTAEKDDISKRSKRSKSSGRASSRSRLRTSASDRRLGLSNRDGDKVTTHTARSGTTDTGSVGGRSSKSKNSQANSQNGEKRKKSKMEKIEQLQAKNALYKEEYKRVQKDKKHLKKEIETKKLEVASLSKEIDTYIAETTMLKSQLSEALQQLDKNEDTESGGNADELAMELSRTRAELEVAVKRVADLKVQIEKLQKDVSTEEEKVENLTEEVATQAMQLRELQMENAHLKDNAKDNERVPELQDENERLQEELTTTLERAAAMVKEREDAIADLLKENDEIKDILASKESSEDGKGNGASEELVRLRDEINAVNTTLEETQDRNVYLEEEVENWVQRGGEMEKEIARLQDELDVLERRTAAAEASLESANAKNEQISTDLDSARNALTSAEERHQQLVSELTNKHHQQISNMATNHKTALLEAKSRYAEELEKERARDSEKEATDVVDQGEMLRRAMANRKQPAQDNAKGGWFGFGVARSASEDGDLDETQQKIRDLEGQNAKKDEEIKQLKSDLVRSRSTYNETIYMNKKQIEELTQENSAYAAKIATLEQALANAQQNSL